MNNFSWQFDDAFFERIVDGRGLGSALNISTKITSFARDVVEYNNSLHMHGAKPSSSLPAADIDYFPELLARVIDKKQEFEGIEKKDRLEVREAYAKLKPERDLITWNVNKRVPGLFGQGRPGNNHVKEYTMHLRGVWRDPGQPGHAIAAFGQKMDNWIELTVISGDAQSANRHALWLERTLEESRWIFQYNGFERLLFDERKMDTFEDIGSNSCYKRHLVYFVRTEKIVLHRVALLKKLIFDICMAPYNENPEDAAKFSSNLNN